MTLDSNSMPKRIQVTLDDELVEQFEALAAREARALGNMGMILIREAMEVRQEGQQLMESQIEGYAAALGDKDLAIMMKACCEEFLKRHEESSEP